MIFLQCVCVFVCCTYMRHGCLIVEMKMQNGKSKVLQHTAVS